MLQSSWEPTLHSIILIHDIGGDPQGTWIASNGVDWPKDLLPSRIPSARIITYGYHLDARASGQLKSLYDHGNDLLTRLLEFRHAVCNSLLSVMLKNIH